MMQHAFTLGDLLKGVGSKGQKISEWIIMKSSFLQKYEQKIVRISDL